MPDDVTYLRLEEKQTRSPGRKEKSSLPCSMPRPSTPMRKLTPLQPRCTTASMWSTTPTTV